MNHPTTHPAELQLDAPIEVANWRPAVNWLLDVPHLMIANALGSVANVLSIISWFSIVFTGKLPDGIARFQCMVLRYEARTFSYLIFLRETYPAFEFDMTAADPGLDTLRVDITPKLDNRNRLTVAFRLVLVLPILIFTMVVAVVTVLAVVVAFFMVLLTGRWPQSLRRFVLDSGRLMLRVGAYSRLLHDEYPRFTLHDPQASPVAT